MPSKRIRVKYITDEVEKPNIDMGKWVDRIIYAPKPPKTDNQPIPISTSGCLINKDGEIYHTPDCSCDDDYEQGRDL